MERVAEKLQDILNELIPSMSQIEQDRIYKAINRFKSYEDTGLTPEELLSLKTAEGQGLLVKLPCKRGDKIWRICGPKKRKFIGERTVLSVAMRDTDEFEIFTNCWDRLGKTIFLTREEAEKALKETARKEIAVNHIL